MDAKSTQVVYFFCENTLEAWKCLRRQEDIPAFIVNSTPRAARTLGNAVAGPKSTVDRRSESSESESERKFECVVAIGTFALSFQAKDTQTIHSSTGHI
jgi:hypothetical protein